MPTALVSTDSTQKLLLTATEVADMLQLSGSQVYDLVASRQIPGIRIGRSVRIPRQALLAWIDQNSLVAV